jgi:hypothetical protein
MPRDSLFGFGKNDQKLRTKSVMDNSKEIGSIGWGVGNANLNIRNERRVMRE